MTAPKPASGIRVLVIDDSAYNRQAIVEMLEADPEISVVGLACNGEEGIKEVNRLHPDVITLDLEMPKMDGFTFLRILMSRAPLPVIVISSYSRKQNVFKALELGALDFIAKPARYLSPELDKIRKELIDKVKLVRLLRREGLAQAAPVEPETEPWIAMGGAESLAVVALGASTGGPQALQRVLQQVPKQAEACYLVAQHMPAGFTQAFSERLDRLTGLRVREARGGERLEAGLVLVAPGGKNMVVRRSGDQLLVEVEQPAPEAKYVPSIDALFSSVAAAVRSAGMGVLLTGMGNDGCQGMQDMHRAGAVTVAESEESAVVYGMPKEAVDRGVVDQVAHLDDLPKVIGRFLQGRVVDDDCKLET